jgi:hypothetical protein
MGHYFLGNSSGTVTAYFTMKLTAATIKVSVLSTSYKIVSNVLLSILCKNTKLLWIFSVDSSHAGKEKEEPTVDLCVCGLFNDAVGSSDYISSNGTIIKEGWIGKDREKTVIA